MDAEKLKKIKKWMPKNGASEIAKKTGMHRTAVYKVLDGDFNNTMVLNMALHMAIKEKARIEENERLIEKL